MLKRVLTQKEAEFLDKLQDLFATYNAIIFCKENKEICIEVEVKEENEGWSDDISFNQFLDDTDIDELFEDNCELIAKLHP